MNSKAVDYKLMRFRKYYDAIRTNKSFIKASLKDKYNIISNVLKFFNISQEKPLVIKNKPVTAQIEPTAECNLKCKFCVRYSGKVPIGRMSLENFKKIIDKLEGLYKLGISGQGELFIHPEVFDMIKYANDKGILVNINSNGTLITKDVIEKLCKLDIGEIGISVDSTKKEKYEKVRIGANHNKLLENIKNLTDELKKRKKESIVTISPIIFKNNIDEIPEFVNLAEKLGVKKVAFQTLQTKENYLKSYSKEMKSQVIKEEIEKLKEKMKEGKKLADEKGITIIFDEEESPGCVWPWRGIYIAWDGEITPCCKIVETKEYSMGNILKQNFWDVWNGEKYQNLRRLLRERKPYFACRGCNRI